MKRRVYRDGTVKELRGGAWVEAPRHKAVLRPVLPQVEDHDDADEEE